MSSPANLTATESQPLNATADFDVYNFRYWLSGITGSIVCAIGLLGNALNVLIQLKMFRTKSRSNAPITLFLLVMAICDVLVLLIYILYDLVCLARPSGRPLIYVTDVKDLQGTFTYFLYHVWYFPANIFVTCSNWSIVAVMCFRFVAVYFPLRAKTWCSLGRAKNSVILIILASIVVVIPDCLTIRLDSTNTSSFVFEYTALSNNTAFLQIYFTFFEGFNSFLPFVVCTFLSIMLIRTLNRTDSALIRVQSRGARTKQSETSRQKRISIMLLGITSWFIFCTCPSFVCRIVTLLKEEYDNSAFYQIFRGVADFFLLLNHAANFVLYAATSDIYRRCLMDLLLCRDRRELERQSTVSMLQASTKSFTSKNRFQDGLINSEYDPLKDDCDNNNMHSGDSTL